MKGDSNLNLNPSKMQGMILERKLKTPKAKTASGPYLAKTALSNSFLGPLPYLTTSKISHGAWFGVFY
jgi:hypothetical protein